MRERTAPTVEDIDLVGGRLCLDFVNTANWLDEAPVDERLTAFADLAAWGRRQGLIGKDTEVRLKQQSAGDAASTDRALAAAIRLRAATRRLLSGNDEAADLEALNRALAAPAPLLAEGGGKTVLHPSAGDLSDWLLHPLAASTAELMTSPSRTKIKVCPGDRCGWIFLDESPSGRRRWCSMATCGNRRKARAHYSRHKGGA